MKKKFLFGPVKSRRLGISLGVDCVPAKSCNLNCVYCECGAADNFFLQAQMFFPVSDIEKELADYLDQKPMLDYITFSGAGEPLLYAGLGELAGLIKKKYPEYKIALLTNGVLFSCNYNFSSLSVFDLIIPSFDAASEDVFRIVNRPGPGITAQALLDGLIALRKNFTGKIWLEIFFIKGINDSNDEVKKLAAAAEKINPEKVQINSLDRPGAEKWAVPPALERLQEINHIIPRSEIITRQAGAFLKNPEIKKNIADFLSRRPVTAADLSVLSGQEKHTVQKQLDELQAQGRIKSSKTTAGIFYISINNKNKQQSWNS
ncbi:MAG TPA: radical SAM protein [Spirochaetia bacterium]|nr:radical SAM protein [Spirochaetia bacterium]